MKERTAWLRSRQLAIRLVVAALLLLAILLFGPPLRLFAHAQGEWLALHLVLELMASVVAALVVVISWQSLEDRQRQLSNAAVVGFAVVAACDLVHALSYDGMPDVLSPSSTNKALFFWLMGRLAQSLTLLAMAARLRLRGAPAPWFFSGIALSLVLLWLGCRHLDWFPASYHEGQGLTPFKVAFEYGLCAANLAAARVFWRRAGREGRSRGFLLAAACVLLALGEVVFASYKVPEDSLNVLGHVFKVGADWLIFRAVFLYNIRRPYEAARQSAQSLQERETQLADLLRQLPGGVSRLDRDNRFLFVNDAHAQWFGLSAGQMIGRSLAEVVSPERQRRMAPQVAKVLAGEPQVFENRVVLDSGEVRYRHTTMAPERTADGAVCGYIVFAIDITERKNMEIALEQNQSRLRTLVNALPDMVFVKDLEGLYHFCNPVFEQFAGRSESAILGHSDRELFLSEDALRFGLRDQEVLKSGRPVVYEEEKVFADGHAGVFETIKTPLRDAAGQVAGVLGVSRDITDRKRAEKEIERLAFYDALTDLPNRRLLVDRLNQAMLSSARTGHYGALLFIDLDNFKDLNDTLGHDLGDWLLRLVGRRLVAGLRAADTVARFGGDEFVLMLEELSLDRTAAAEQTERVAEKLLASLNQPYELKEIEHYSTPSIGITLFRGTETRVDELLKRADLAMYQAKAGGRNTWRFFDPQMQAAVTARAILEGDLRLGLMRGELILYFQPLVDEQQKMVGAEALVRWAHPQRGMVSPGEFIPLAEQTGLILPLGQWVLQRACAQLVAWAQRPQTRELSISVNVSARQFRHPDFVGLVRRLLDESGAQAQKLQLELTESLLLTDVEDMIAKMTELRMAGVRFSLDDFGTGYSSLSYLKRLPLDQLKIDQSFVRDVLVDPNDAAIVRTVLALAGSLDLAVVAEGVETRGQLEFLRHNGCRGFQGYLFGRPAPIEVLEQAQGLRP
ncbi:MAG: EAL domain-containing protein [Curvibacter sp.]|nr:EAL domain-containing protein [Curvibacter sp.]